MNKKRRDLTGDIIADNAKLTNEETKVLETQKFDVLDLFVFRLVSIPKKKSNGGY